MLGIESFGSYMRLQQRDTQRLAAAIETLPPPEGKTLASDEIARAQLAIAMAAQVPSEPEMMSIVEQTTAS